MRVDKIAGEVCTDWYEQQCVEYGYREPDPDAYQGGPDDPNQLPEEGDDE